MLTLFTTPKPFSGRAATAQRNSLRSWSLLDPVPEIIVFGRDEGVAEAAAEVSAIHIPDIACNEHGTPLVNALFEEAQRLASNDLLCYVNCDIILMSDFLPAVRTVTDAEKSFLMVGQRWDLDMPENLDFAHSGWEADLRALARERGELFGPAGIDYFVFRRGLYRKMLPLAIGRAGWDNWALFEAWRRGAVLVDATLSVMVLHQNHDYEHVGGRRVTYKGPEAGQNRRMGGREAFTLDEATHVLKEGALSKLKKNMFQRIFYVAIRKEWTWQIYRFFSRQGRSVRRRWSSLLSLIRGGKQKEFQ